MEYYSLNKAIESTVRKNWTHPALSDYNSSSVSYAQLANKIARLHIFFEKSGLKQGDHVSLCGKNSSHWAAVALALMTYGAVTVPLLHDFNAETIEHLVNHSDSKLFFVDRTIWKHLSANSFSGLNAVIAIDDYSVLYSSSGSCAIGDVIENDSDFDVKYPGGLSPALVRYPDDTSDQLVLVNYTSGSTGFSKGVMITRGNLMSNERFALENIPYLHPDDGTISMLPMAHMFGLAIELLFPLLKGCHIHFLSRVPAPTVILKSFSEVHPKLVIAVPLILEKIIKNKVFPVLDKPVMRILVRIPGVNKLIFDKIRRQLLDAFGGQLQQIVVGGAALDKTVERFLRRIKFPYTVGYGMTECSPLISYEVWDKHHEGSVGRMVDRMEFRIDSPDPEKIPGEMWVRGDNVMKGYYKNPDATESVFRDGWMDTGDICQVDSDGYIYIRGRNKSMILGPSGQNIYPEEIEAKLNNLPFVAESLIVERSGRLFALIHPDYEKAKEQGIDDAAIENIMTENISRLNGQVASYEQVAGMEIMHDEFEKTPKRSIKRFMYK